MMLRNLYRTQLPTSAKIDGLLNFPKPGHIMRSVFLLAITYFSVLLSGCEQPAVKVSQPESSLISSRTAEYANPVIPGFNPDPSIVRVGKDYYLATSTFEYFPGVPIYHSRNLVNWTLIGHALHRPEQLDLEGVKSTAGIYAPTLRYNKGVFYMTTTMVAPGRTDKPSGNFFVTASRPEGPWSLPKWIDNAPGIDPSLFFDDDGRVYLSGNRRAQDPVDRHHRIIWTQELDLESGQLVGPRWDLDSKVYFESGALGSVAAFEGPHLYKKGGAYYLIVSHGGTGMGHAVSIWRSENVSGPWKINPANPILTHRGYARSGINATGHADFVQTPESDWWTVFLGVRSWDKKRNPMGRETFLAPMDWEDKWPVVNPRGPVGRTDWYHEQPVLANIREENHNFYDDFDAETLGLDWTFVRTPKTKWWSLVKKENALTLALRKERVAEYSQPSFLGVRINAPRIEASTQVDFSPEAEGEKAGLALIRGHDPFFGAWSKSVMQVRWW